MSTSNATARPWEVLSTATKNPRTSEWREIRSGVAGVVRCDSFDVHRSGESYTECGVRISAADAALIVRAVNSHEALVAALRDLLDGSEPWDVRATQARAALALAEQG